MVLPSIRKRRSTLGGGARGAELNLQRDRCLAVACGSASTSTAVVACITGSCIEERAQALPLHGSPVRWNCLHPKRSIVS